MAMQTDVQASVPITVDGQFTDQAANNLGRTRVKSVYIVPGGTAGSVVFKRWWLRRFNRYDNKHGGFRYPTNVHVDAGTGRFVSNECVCRCDEHRLCHHFLRVTYGKDPSMAA
jgi:hypothetical protein